MDGGVHLCNQIPNFLISDVFTFYFHLFGPYFSSNSDMLAYLPLSIFSVCSSCWNDFGVTTFEYDFSFTIYSPKILERFAV